MSGRGVWTDPQIWGLVGALGVSVWGSVHFLNLTFDDVFISFRYAENLVSGKGLVFNEGERVEGFSNFLWTLLLGIPALLGASSHEYGMLWAAKAGGLLLSLGTVTLLWATLRGALGGRGAWGPVLLPLYLAALAPFQAWSVIGLETALVTFLIAGAFYEFRRESVAGSLSRFGSAIWLVLAALTRPEPVALGGLFVIARAIQLKSERGWNRTAALRYLAAFALPYAAFLAFRYGYYGEWVPNTYFAKLHDDPRALPRGLRYVSVAIEDLGLTSLAVLTGLALALRRRVTVWGGLVFATCALQVAGVIYEGGDWMPGFRMLIPALPAFCLVLGEAWGVFDDCSLPAQLIEGAEGEKRLRAVRLILSGVMAYTLTTSALASPTAVRARGFPSGWSKVKLDAFVHYEAARWMKKNLEPGLLAIGEAGVVPYVTGFATLDMFGLTDAHIARQPGRMHAKFDKEYVFRRDPRYIYLVMTMEQEPRPAHPHGRILLADDRFEQRYRLRKKLPRTLIYERN